MTKFVKKSQIPEEYWIPDPVSGDAQIPIELHFLSTLRHPNIVSLFDAFENVDFYQWVMPKHGSGMDLFEFIERRPLMDEYLASFIYRQIVSAVAFLHANSIAHRDLKDENVIINEFFDVQLIDFGSAAYFKPGEKFSTFYGTIEYCSPDVLRGEKKMRASRHYVSNT